MKTRRTGRFAAALFLAAALVAVGVSPPLRAFESLPDTLFLKSGAQTELCFTLPGSAELQTGSTAVISSFDQSTTNLGSTVTLTAGEEAGEATLTYRLLGLIPVKTVSVTVETERTLVPRRAVGGRGAADRRRGGGRLLGRGQDAQPRVSGGHPRRRPHRARGRHARHRLGAAARAHRRGRRGHPGSDPRRGDDDGQRRAGARPRRRRVPPGRGGCATAPPASAH